MPQSYKNVLFDEHIYQKDVDHILKKFKEQSYLTCGSYVEIISGKGVSGKERQHINVGRRDGGLSYFR